MYVIPSQPCFNSRKKKSKMALLRIRSIVSFSTLDSDGQSCANTLVCVFLFQERMLFTKCGVNDYSMCSRQQHINLQLLSAGKKIPAHKFSRSAYERQDCLRLSMPGVNLIPIK